MSLGGRHVMSLSRDFLCVPSCGIRVWDVEASFVSEHASGQIKISSAVLAGGYVRTAVEKRAFACVFSVLND